MIEFLLFIIFLLTINIIIDFFSRDVSVSRRMWKEFNRKEKVHYSFKINKWILFSIPFILIILLVSNTLFAAILCIVLLFVVTTFKSRSKLKEQEDSQRIFKDFLLSISSSIKAGNSIQNALIKGEFEVEKQYRGISNPTLYNLSLIKIELDLGFELSVILKNLRDRTNVEEVETFCNNIIIINDKGGKLSEIIEQITTTILDKILLKQEIATLTSGKRMEANILTWFPFVIGGFLYLISPEYFTPLIDNLLGQLLLLLSVVFLVLNAVIARKIVRIEL